MRDSDDMRIRAPNRDRQLVKHALRDRLERLEAPRPAALAAPRRTGQRVSRARWHRAVKRVRELNDRVGRLTQENDELRLLAYRDTLTGLMNRRGFSEHLHRVVDRANERQVEVALLLFDVDELKRINDTRGHAAGDVALRSVAEALRLAVRSGDHVGRLSGDEFAVLLPLTGRKQARRIAERVRTALQEASAAAGFGVTVSAGVGVIEKGSPRVSADHLLRRADRALYAAKRAGRNRVDDAPQCACGK